MSKLQFLGAKKAITSFVWCVCGFGVIFSVPQHFETWLQDKQAFILFYRFFRATMNFNKFLFSFAVFFSQDAIFTLAHETCAQRWFVTFCATLLRTTMKLSQEFFLLFALEYYLWWFLWLFPLSLYRALFRMMKLTECERNENKL